MPTTTTPRATRPADDGDPGAPGAAPPWDPERLRPVLVDRPRWWSRRARVPARVPARVRAADPRREVVGWCDARSPRRGWLLVPHGGAVVGLVLAVAAAAYLLLALLNPERF
ncbi:potassium-transporting ATPase subunit F [Kineococcus indalonis]|uniref:potassium-transporting ATPase subunit F n=1 Tax=Kineococcus indalonis TaxID=2696566 RepID=UPI00196A9651|nr:potassium-transporting ATPase subunit F [Kineococcus indalonis]